MAAAIDRPAPTRGWRPVVSAILLFVGALLLPLSVVSVWLRNQVLDTDRFVDTMAPLASDPDIQAAAATRVTNGIMSAVDVEQLAQDALPERAQFLAAPLSNGVRSFVQEHAEDALASPQFQELWDRAIRLAHEQVDALLTGKDQAVQIVDGEVVLDLGRLLDRVRDRLVDRGITVLADVDLGKVDSTFTLFEAKSLESAQSGTQLLEDAAVVLPFLMLASFTGAVLLASDRRRVLMHVGFAIALSAALLSVALVISRAVYLESVSGFVVSPDAASSTFDIVVRNIRNAIRILILVGLFISAGAFVAGPSPAAARVRDVFRLGPARAGRDASFQPGRVTTWIADHVAVARILPIGAAVLVLALWNQPRPRSVLFLGLLLLVALAFVEAAARAARAPDSETAAAAGS